MKHNAIAFAPIVAALLLSPHLASAADNKPAGTAETKAIGAAKAPDASAKAAKDKPAGTAETKASGAAKAPLPSAKAAAVKLVDINGASKAELKTLPGIGDAEADKIIAGRPYGSKSHLFTRDIVSGVVYDNLKARVIAMQKGTPVPKPGQK